jgi:hypothetical protein
MRAILKIISLYIYMNIHKPINRVIVNRHAKNVGLFCNARDEKNMREWAAHHLLIGFDIIIIFDHKSINPLSNVFKKFDKRVKIIRIDSNINNIKVFLMNQATEIAKKYNMDWFIYLDADEFLMLNNCFKGVKHFLNTYSYADSIGVNWLMFGTNYLVNDPSENSLIIESYTKSHHNLDTRVKSFVRPNEIINNSQPHFYNMKNPSRMLGIDFKIMSTPYCFNPVNIPYFKAPAYIAHYLYQSEETYKRRKINLKPDDGTPYRTDMGKTVHTLYNDITNIQPQKYLKNIKEFLDYYS